jgi:hypothetical protein
LVVGPVSWLVGQLVERLMLLLALMFYLSN